MSHTVHTANHAKRAAARRTSFSLDTNSVTLLMTLRYEQEPSNGQSDAGTRICGHTLVRSVKRWNAMRCERVLTNETSLLLPEGKAR